MEPMIGPLLAAEIPYTVALLASAVAALFAALGKVALVLVQRADRAHLEVIAQLEKRLAESEERGDQWRSLALAEHTTTKDAVDVAVKKVRP